MMVDIAHDDPKPGPMAVKVGQKYRHKKTRGIYIVTEFATLEKDMTTVVIYRAAHFFNAVPWVRPLSEFQDGRFEPVEDESQ